MVHGDKYKIMIFATIILFTAVLLSAVAAYYSIAGLTAIFSAAVIPVIIMGATMELGKVVATVWLHNNWKRANWVFKTYLVPAIAFLMILTSMGIFGFLSKAHSDQGLVSGDAMSKVAIYDEKIATEKDNVAQAKKAIEQMNSQVDQMMGRTDSDTGAQRAVNIRKGQAKERAALQAEITKSQKIIQQLQEERAPIAAEFRKVEAEVGPIKYIAALIYGDNPDANVLERAVRWVIILIVVVFDPLALCLILAGNKQIEWAREDKIAKRKQDELEAEEEIIHVKKFLDTLDEHEPVVPADEPQLERIEKLVESIDIEKVNAELADIQPEPKVEVIEPEPKIIEPEPEYESVMPEPLPVEVIQPVAVTPEPIVEELPDEQIELLKETALALVDGVVEPEPVTDFEAIVNTPVEEPIDYPIRAIVEHVEEPAVGNWDPAVGHVEIIEEEIPEVTIDEVTEEEIKPLINDSLIETEGQTIEAFKRIGDGYVQYEGKRMHERVLRVSNPDLFKIYEEGSNNTTLFGTAFPQYAASGDMYVRVDVLPHSVYKFSKDKWIEVNKELSDTYLYNEKYLQYLVEKIGSGEIDPDILTGPEQEMIEQFIRKGAV